jgi:predicted MFS family arabinose efflux permease
MSLTGECNQPPTPSRPPSTGHRAGPASTEGNVISQEASAPVPQAGDAPGPVPGSAPASFGEVFAVGEFRALWLAQVLSVAGDQLARVALTLLVFDRTHSALLAAVTFAASVVPTFVGGIVLSGLADRLPRREVMIACDLLRAALVAVMAVQGLPIAALVCLLFGVTMISAPFTSARAALYPEILTGDRYVLGTAVTLTTLQFAQVLGFAAGGAVVGIFGVRMSLLADAATFLFSAAITRLLVAARPAAQPRSRPGARPQRGMFAAVRLVFATPALRTPMLFGWLAAFYNAPEGVSAPLAATLGGGAVAVGLLLASQALGASVGAITFSRFVAPCQRLRLMAPLAVLACGMLVLFVLRPPLPVALAILMLSGICDCYQLAANASFVSAAPPQHRSGAFGLAQSGMTLSQGAAMVAAGALAQHHSPSAVIAAVGAIGALCAVLVATSGGKDRGRSGDHA